MKEGWLAQQLRQASSKVRRDEYVSAHRLEWGTNYREGTYHDELHTPCGCAVHLAPFPHVHPCSAEHMRPDLHMGDTYAAGWRDGYKAHHDVLRMVRNERDVARAGFVHVRGVLHDIAREAYRYMAKEGGLSRPREFVTWVYRKAARED